MNSTAVTENTATQSPSATQGISPSQLLTTKQVSRIYGIPKATLEFWRWGKRGPTYVKMGRSVRYKVGEVESWLEANTVESDETGEA